MGVGAALLAVALLFSCGKREQAPGTLSNQLPPKEEASIVTLQSTLREIAEFQTPKDVDADVFEQLKTALARQLSTYSQSRRDPGEGRVNFSPAGRAGLKPSILLEEPAPAGREGQRPSPTSSALRFVSNPPTGTANRVTDLALIDNLVGTFTLT